MSEGDGAARKKGALRVAAKVVLAVAAVAVSVACYESWCLAEVSGFADGVREGIASDDEELLEKLGFDCFKPIYYPDGAYLKVSEFEVVNSAVAFGHGVVYAKCVYDQLEYAGYFREYVGDYPIGNYYYHWYVTCWLTIPIEKSDGAWHVSGHIHGFA